MVNLPHFSKFRIYSREEVNHWWYFIFGNEDCLRSVTTPNAPLKPAADHGLIYYYYVDGQLKYIGKTTASLSRRMTFYKYKSHVQKQMLNAFRAQRLTIITKEVAANRLDQMEVNEIRLHSRTNRLWNIQHNRWHLTARNLYAGAFMVTITAMMIVSFIFLITYLLPSLDYFLNNVDYETETVEPKPQQADVEKIASILEAYKQAHNRLPAYEEITAPYPTDNPSRTIFSYDGQTLSFFLEAHIGNSLRDGRLIAGQSYYTATPSVSFDKIQPLPDVNNFHIVVGYSCQTDTFKTHNLSPADTLNFAIIYYLSQTDLYYCVDG